METLRQRKKRAQNAAWAAMTPGERLAKGYALAQSARKLRAAGLAALGVSAASALRAHRRRGA